MDLQTQKQMIRKTYKQAAYQECLELIDQTPENVKNSSEYKILKATCLNYTGRSEVAHKLLDEIIKLEPRSAIAHYGKGLVYIDQGKLNASIRCFDTAIEIDPSEKMDKARQMKTRAQNLLKPVKLEPMDDDMELSGHSIFSTEKPVVKLPEPTKPTKVKAAEPKKKNQKRVRKVQNCNVCEKKFSSNFSLTRHLLLHTGERPFVCPVCDFGFIQKSDLSRHVAIHSDAADFKCNICPKTFKTKKNLQCHQRSHSKLRPFKCQICPKDFKHRRLLNYHNTLHAQNSLFECDQCGKFFKAKKTMAIHQKEHLVDFKPRIIKVKQEPTEHVDSLLVEVEPIKFEILNEDEEIVDFVADASASECFGNFINDRDADSDWEFCLSLLKSLSSMNGGQKTQFKEKARCALKDILG